VSRNQGECSTAGALLNLATFCSRRLADARVSFLGYFLRRFRSRLR